jgi:hypothetical protein
LGSWLTFREGDLSGVESEGVRGRPVKIASATATVRTVSSVKSQNGLNNGKFFILMGRTRKLSRLCRQRLRRSCRLLEPIRLSARCHAILQLTRRRGRSSSLYFLAGTIWTRTPSGPVTKTDVPFFSAFIPGTTRLTVARAASVEKPSTAIPKWSIGLIGPLSLCTLMEFPADPSPRLNCVGLGEVVVTPNSFS